MKAALGTHSAGVLMLGVHDLKKPALYSCTSAEIINTLNTIPSATLVVGEGFPLSADEETAYYTSGELDDLLQESIELRKVGTVPEDTAISKMLRCTIYEADTKSTDMKAVFRGYIVNVFEVHRAGTMSVRALRVQCLGIAAILHVAPLAGYRRTSGVAIVNAAAGGSGELPTASTSLSSAVVDSYSALANTSDDFIVATYYDQLKDKDVVTKIAWLANTISYMGDIHSQTSEYTQREKLDDERLHIKDCVFCDYKLHMNKFAIEAENSFNKYICGHLLQSLQQSSILLSIVGMCTSTDVMMDFVPHFKLGGSADDFRMELKPTDAWNAAKGANVLTIPNTCVTSCNSTLNHMEHLGDPQVLIVNYSSGVGSTGQNEQAGQMAGCFGVYSPIPSVMLWAQYRYDVIAAQNERIPQLDNTLYKTRFYLAPRWLDWSYLASGHGPAAAEKIQDKPDDTTVEERNHEAEILNLKEATNKADEIAKALYSHLHGSSDTAVFDLTPDLRFGLNEDVGCLEDHIGKLVDVNGYRGMLHSVRYSYTSGKTTAGSFSITLSRVRPISEDESEIECPLYEKVYNNREEETGNGEFWQDTWKYNPSDQQRQ